MLKLGRYPPQKIQSSHLKLSLLELLTLNILSYFLFTFIRCLSSLSKLLELRKNDPKVQHNKTVAQFYHSHCTGPEECGRSLLKIRKQVSSLTALYLASVFNLHENDVKGHCITGKKFTCTCTPVPSICSLNVKPNILERTIFNE